jgi:hypothetical protein
MEGFFLVTKAYLNKAHQTPQTSLKLSSQKVITFIYTWHNTDQKIKKKAHIFFFKH